MFIFIFFGYLIGNLEYVPERGSANDAHIDDAWAWGRRLATLSLLSDSAMTFSIIRRIQELSSLAVDLYTAKDLSDTCGCRCRETYCAIDKEENATDLNCEDVRIVVRVELPARSLLGMCCCL